MQIYICTLAIPHICKKNKKFITYLCHASLTDYSAPNPVFKMKEAKMNSIIQLN